MTIIDTKIIVKISPATRKIDKLYDLLSLGTIGTTLDKNIISG